MLRTRSSIIRLAQFQGSLPYISGTSSSRSARRLWTYGERILASFSGKYPMIAEWI